jgi:hypothetical protein
MGKSTPKRTDKQLWRRVVITFLRVGHDISKEIYIHVDLLRVKTRITQGIEEHMNGASYHEESDNGQTNLGSIKTTVHKYIQGIDAW